MEGWDLLTKHWWVPSRDGCWLYGLRLSCRCGGAMPHCVDPNSVSWTTVFFSFWPSNGCCWSDGWHSTANKIVSCKSAPRTDGHGISPEGKFELRDGLKNKIMWQTHSERKPIPASRLLPSVERESEERERRMRWNSKNRKRERKEESWWEDL